MNGRFRDGSVALLEPVDMDDESEVEGESTEGLPSISSELAMQVASSDKGWIARHGYVKIELWRSDESGVRKVSFAEFQPGISVAVV